MAQSPMDVHDTLGEMEKLSMDGVLRCRSPEQQPSALAGTGPVTRQDAYQMGGRGGRPDRNGYYYHHHENQEEHDSSDSDRTLEALEECQATTTEPQSNKFLGTRASATFSRKQLSVSCGTLSSSPRRIFQCLGCRWNAFFHARTTVQGCQWAGILRIAFAVTALSNVLMLGWDFGAFFLPSSTRIPVTAGRDTMDQDTWTVLEWMPQTDYAYQMAFGLYVMHLILLGLGVAPRYQAAGVYFWTCMFRHHNNVLWNDEDTVMKQLAFFLLFWPLDHYTIWTVMDSIVAQRQRPSTSKTKEQVSSSWPMWPFRLVQIQMCLIFISTGLLKWTGEDWWDGSAVYYVVHIDDLYGNWFNPSWIFGYRGVLQVLTWATLVLEVAAPILIWFPRTRWGTLGSVLAFHVGLDASMNLNFFHWIMTVGWLSFLIQPDAKPAGNGGSASKKDCCA